MMPQHFRLTFGGTAYESVKRITFGLETPLDPALVADTAVLKSLANLYQGPGRVNHIGAALVEVSDDGGETWRMIVDERERYQGAPPPKYPHALSPDEWAARSCVRDGMRIEVSEGRLRVDGRPIPPGALAALAALANHARPDEDRTKLTPADHADVYRAFTHILLRADDAEIRHALATVAQRINTMLPDERPAG